MRLKSIIIAVSVGVALLISIPILVIVGGFAYSNWELQRIKDSYSESQVINKTRDLPEVKMFIAKYPSHHVRVDKSGDLLVTYSISKSASEGRAEPDATKDLYLNLDVWLHTRTLEPSQISYSCYRGNNSDVRVFDGVKCFGESDVVENPSVAD